jgi:hypothetical protein
VRFKKNHVQFEFSGQAIPIDNANEFNDELMEKLKMAFNNLSEKEIK